jgi:hypothetical protein
MTTRDLPYREKAAAELAAVQRKAERLATVPDLANLPDGTLIRWRDSRNNRAFAVKNGLNRWHYGSATWNDDTLLQNLTFGSGPIEVATSWDDVRVDAQPTLQVSQNGYVLTDPTRGISWTRDGDEWVRL